MTRNRRRWQLATSTNSLNTSTSPTYQNPVVSICIESCLLLVEYFVQLRMLHVCICVVTVCYLHPLILQFIRTFDMPVSYINSSKYSLHLPICCLPWNDFCLLVDVTDCHHSKHFVFWWINIGYLLLFNSYEFIERRLAYLHQHLIVRVDSLAHSFVFWLLFLSPYHCQKHWVYVDLGRLWEEWSDLCWFVD